MSEFTRLEGIVDLILSEKQNHRTLYGPLTHISHVGLKITDSRIATNGDSIRVVIPAAVIVGCWAICWALSPEPWTPNMIHLNDRLVFIRHMHWGSDLACATTYVDRLQWMCYVCGEEVPPGILFMARTERLG